MVRPGTVLGSYVMMTEHDGRAGVAEADLGPDEEDLALAAELGRRLDALHRGEARTISRVEMKERLARRRASRSSR